MGFISPGSLVRIQPPLFVRISLSVMRIASPRASLLLKRDTNDEIRFLPPSSSGLGYQVLILETGVRLPLGVVFNLRFTIDYFLFLLCRKDYMSFRPKPPFLLSHESTEAKWRNLLKNSRRVGFSPPFVADADIMYSGKSQRRSALYENGHRASRNCRGKR